MAIIANAQGRVAGTFNIPKNVPTGAKRVTFRGSGGSEAVATYTAQGWRTITTAAMTSVTQLLPISQPFMSQFSKLDPIAQTHSFQSDRQIRAYDIMIAKLGDRSKPIILQMRNTINGYPGSEVLNEAVLDVKDITPGRVWHRMRFPLSYLARAETDYAIVTLCDDPDHAVYVAEVGGFDQQRSWVGAQPYQVGSFFSASDNKAWLVHPKIDQTFRAVADKYTRTEERIDLGVIDVANMSDVIPLILVDRPQGTEVEVEITLPDDQKIITTPLAAVQLGKHYSGQIKIALTLRGSATLSPIIYPEAQLVIGNMADTGRYVSRAFKAAKNTTIQVIADMKIPGDASAVASVQIGENTEGPIWQTILSQPAVTPLSEGFSEYEWQVPFNPNPVLDHTRVRFDWIGNPNARPEIRRVRATTLMKV